jgi:YggT family protein
MLITIIQTIRRIIYILVLLKIVLSYFMDPFHPFRQFVDKLIDPMLKPIQKVIPTFGRYDFSPLILILLVEIFTSILITII